MVDNFIAVILFSSIMTFAVPADKTLTFILQSDERISLAMTFDNYSLLTNRDGNWVYAILNLIYFIVSPKLMLS